MDGFELVAKILEVIVNGLTSLAWPAALIWIVWYTKSEVKELLKGATIKYKDLLINLPLAEAEAEATQLPAPPADQVPVVRTPEESAKFEKLIEISPAAAVVELRSELERELARLWTAAFGHESRGSLSGTIRLLEKREIIDTSTAALLNDLRGIGNTAAHGISSGLITSDDARRYRKLFDAVKPLLRVKPQAFESDN